MSAARALRRLGRAAGIGALLLVVLIGAALASLDTKAGRAFVASEVNGVLARIFKGKVVIRRIAHLGLKGARGVETIIEDPSGAQVAHATVASADVDTVALLRSFFLSRSGPRIVEVTHLDVDDTDLRLDTDASGRLDLLDALQLAQAPETEPADAESSRGIRVALDRITLRHGHVYRMSRLGPALVDADLDEARGSVVYTPEATEVDVRDGHVRARKFVGGADVAGRLRGHLRVPGVPDPSPGAHVEWTGAVGEVSETLEGTMADRHVDAVLRSTLGAASLEGDVHATIAGDLEGLEGRGHLAARDLDLHELLPAVPPTRIGFEADVAGRARQMRFEVNADAQPPARSTPDLPSFESVHVEASGVADIPGATFAGELTARARDVAKGNSRAESIKVRASVQGPLARPEIDARVAARGVVAADMKIESALLTAHGPATEPRVTASLRSPDVPDVDARATATLGESLALRALQIDLTRGGESARVTARSLQASARSLSVEGGRIENLGEPLDFSLTFSPPRARLIAKTRGLDVGRACRIGRLGQEVQAGTLTLDTDVELGPGEGTGRVVAGASGLTGRRLRDLAVYLDLSLRGRSVSGKLHASAPYVGNLDVSVPKVTFDGGGPITPATWKRAFGAIDVELSADLARLSAVFPPADLPVSEARGKVALHAHVARGAPADFSPVVSIGLETDKLVLAPRVPVEGEIDVVRVHPRPGWRLEGIDFAVDAMLGGKSGELRGAAQAHDTRGEIAELDFTSTHFPSNVLLADTARLKRALRTTDVEVALTVPERGLGSLPPILRQRYVTGRVRGEATLRGSLERPRVEVSAAVARARFGGSGEVRPMNVDLEARYDGLHGRVGAKARGEGPERVEAEATIEAAAAELLGGVRSGQWSGSAHAHVESFPLQTVGPLDDKQISGAVTGDVALDGLHRDAKLGLSMSVDRLSMGGVGYRSARADFTIDARHVDGSLRLDQDDGYLEASVRAPSSWGARVLPSLDGAGPLEGEVTASEFRLAAFQPFVDATFDELDGRLTTQGLRVELDPNTRGAKVRGKLKVSRGAIEAASAGGELHDLETTVRFEPDGTVALDKLTASGVEGRVEAKGTARLRGLALDSARATLTIPGNGAVPLTVGGVELGRVDGDVEVFAEPGPSGDGTVKVDARRLNVKLSEASTTTAESLGPFPESVRIGAHRGDPARLEPIPLDEAPHGPGVSPWTGPAVEVHLGAVHVARGAELSVDLVGDLRIDPAAARTVTGQIRLKRGGRLDVQGRRFTVENGTVTFLDDPDDPQVVVKAGWKAPDDSIVYATFSGPLKTGKVTLSSEPPLPKEEIVQLVLYGTRSGQQASTATASPEGSALATAGGEAAQPINHMLNQLGLGAVTAKVDASRSASPRPQVELQVARDLSLQIAVVLGQPPPGVNPDRTLLTVDWRFFSQWSLSTTVGDAGSTIFDLLWQHRY